MPVSSLECLATVGAYISLFEDGLGGLWIYIGVFVLVSALLLFKMEFKLNKYFVNKNDVLYGGITNDLLIFLMLWVIIHNLVNIL